MIDPVWRLKSYCASEPNRISCVQLKRTPSAARNAGEVDSRGISSDRLSVKFSFSPRSRERITRGSRATVVDPSRSRSQLTSPEIAMSTGRSPSSRNRSVTRARRLKVGPAPLFRIRPTPDRRSSSDPRFPTRAATFCRTKSEAGVGRKPRSSQYSASIRLVQSEIDEGLVEIVVAMGARRRRVEK